MTTAKNLVGSAITAAVLAGNPGAAYTNDSIEIAPDTPKEIKARKKLESSYNERTIDLTEEQQDFVDNKLASKLWRVDNLYTIRDKDAVKQILKLNPAQKKVLTQFKHSKKIILKSRQQGISTLYLAYYLDSCLFNPGFQAGIQSYGQDEADKLAKRALLMWEEFDEDIKELLGLKLVSNNQKGMTFSNGSILKIGNFRGDTLQGLHVSELGKIARKYPEKAKELKTGAFQAVGKNSRITIESTAEGKSGLFYEIWLASELHKKQGKELGPFDFEPIFLSWLEDPDCNIDHDTEITDELKLYFTKLEKELGITLVDTQKWWYASKKKELTSDMQQEYPTTAKEAFEQSIEGTYYRHEYDKLKILPDLYDENLLVHSAMDLGMNDTFSIGFFQKHPGGQVKIIGEYMNSGHGLQHYWDIYCALSKKFGWEYGVDYVPHDSKVRELIADKTRWVAMKELGFNPVLVTKHRVMDGIEATRQFLRDVVIDRECEVILGAIQNYRKKYDSKFDVFLDAPVHDEYSHTADMIRYMAMGNKNKEVTDIYVERIRPKVSTSILNRGFDV